MARYVDIECDAVTEVLPRRAFKTRQDIQDFLDNIPTADVAPVVHGRWIQVDSTKCRCSHCDIIALIALYPHGDKNFCPQLRCEDGRR